MILQTYADAFVGGIEFLMALGSILGLLILIAGLLGIVLMPSYRRHSMCTVLIVGLMLLFLCGFTTGLEYFGIRL